MFYLDPENDRIDVVVEEDLQAMETEELNIRECLTGGIFVDCEVRQMMMNAKQSLK